MQFYFVIQFLISCVYIITSQTKQKNNFIFELQLLNDICFEKLLIQFEIILFI